MQLTVRHSKYRMCKVVKHLNDGYEDTKVLIYESANVTYEAMLLCSLSRRDL